MNYTAERQYLVVTVVTVLCVTATVLSVLSARAVINGRLILPVGISTSTYIVMIMGILSKLVVLSVEWLWEMY
jgi:hypothetical protein